MLKPRELLGLNLNRLAEKIGISQKEISNSTKLDVGTINRIFKAKQGIREKNLEALAETLDCSIEDLFREPPGPSNVPDFTFAAEFLSKFSGLSPNLQKVVLAIVYKDPSYAADLPKSFGELGRSLGPLLKAQE